MSCALVAWILSCPLTCGGVQDAPAAAPADAIVLRIYDVRDLLRTPRDFPAPTLGRGQAVADRRQEDRGLPKSTIAERANGFLDLLRSGAGASWVDGAGAEAKGGQLVIRQTAAGHDRIAEWLADRRREAGRLVSIEARFLTLDAEAARKLPRGVHVIDPTQGERLLELARTGQGAALLSAPKITAFSGQRANIVVANQVTYVADHDVRVEKGRVVADPVVQVLSEGLAVDVRPTLARDGWVELELRVQLATLLRPMAEAVTRFGPVQVPEVVDQTIAADTRLDPRRWLLVAGLHEVTAEGRAGRPIVALLSLKEVQLGGD